MKTTPAELTQIERLAARRLSTSQIARALGWTYARLINVATRNGIKIAPAIASVWYRPRQEQ